MAISIEIAGTDEAIAAINQILDSLSNLSPLMTQLGDAAIANAQQTFKLQSAPDGSPWAELSPSYVNWKRRKGYSTQKNIRTGRAQASLEMQITGDTLEVGSGAPYFEQMNQRRAVFPAQELPPTNEAEYEEIAGRYFLSIIPDSSV